MDKINDGNTSPEPDTAPLSDSQIIDAFGGSAALSRMCECTSAAISQWKTNGIPKIRRQYLALLRPDLFPRKPKPKIKPRKAGAA